MSELALTLMRLGFLVALWLFVLLTVGVLRRDMRAPQEVRPGQPIPVAATAGGRPGKPPKPPKQPKAAKQPKQPKVKGSALVVTEGALTGTVLPLGTTAITLGRAPDSTLVIDDDFASSRHARIYPSEGGWIVEDLGSTNGTWIDRTRITGPTVLPVGMPLRVGRTTIQLRK